MERSKKHPQNWVSPYCTSIDWIKIFTPIEYDTWNAIRGVGKCPLYPQYPVANYFLDFGNPFLKVGVECDGRDFHMDKKKDNDRDYKLRKLGWKIYRISGSDIWRVPPVEYYELAHQLPKDRKRLLEEFYDSTIEGLIKALSIFYCKYRRIYKDELINENVLVHACLNKRKSKPVKNWTP